MTEEKELYLGCGDENIEGVDHLDIRPLPHVKFVQSAVNLENIPSNEYDRIYTKDLIEHISWRYVRLALKEWYRVLKPRGQIMIETPSAEQLLEVLQHPEDDRQRYGDETAWQFFCRVAFGHQDYPENSHLSYYTPEWLTELLDEAEFVNVEVLEDDGERFTIIATKP